MQLVTKRLKGCIFLHCNPAQSQPITCITIYRYFALRHTAWICHTAFERFIEGCMALYKCLDPYIYMLQTTNLCSCPNFVAHRFMWLAIPEQHSCHYQKAKHLVYIFYITENSRIRWSNTSPQSPMMQLSLAKSRAQAAISGCMAPQTLFNRLRASLISS